MSSEDREAEDLHREVEQLRERVAHLESENERLATALHGRKEMNSTLPLRAINPSAVALFYANGLKSEG